MHKEKWNKKYSSTPLLFPGEPSPVLIKLTGELPPGRALDLASGEGRNAFHLAREGWEVTAVDFSDVAAEKGKVLADKLGLTITWKIEDLTIYSPEPESFDLVCIFYLHLPWSELSEVVRRASAALVPGGTLLVVGHDRSNLEEGSGGPQNPELLYTAEEITGIIGNLETKHAGTRKHQVDHGPADRNTVQIDCIVRAVRPAAEP
jgi:SAM-dependent methyltransferase